MHPAAYELAPAQRGAAPVAKETAPAPAPREEAAPLQKRMPPAAALVAPSRPRQFRPRRDAAAVPAGPPAASELAPAQWELAPVATEAPSKWPSAAAPVAGAAAVPALWVAAAAVPVGAASVPAPREGAATPVQRAAAVPGGCCELPRGAKNSSSQVGIGINSNGLMFFIFLKDLSPSRVSISMFQPPIPMAQGSKGPKAQSPTKGRGDPPESQRGAAALQMVHGSSRPESRVPPPAGGGGAETRPCRRNTLPHSSTPSGLGWRDSRSDYVIF